MLLPPSRSRGFWDYLQNCPAKFLRRFYPSRRHGLALPPGAEQLLLSGQRAGGTHHPPPLDIQRQVHVLFGPYRGDVAIKAAVEPGGVTGLHGTPVAGTALHQEPLLAQALHAGVTGHQLHPVEPVQPTEVQIGHAVVRIGKEKRHDEDKQECRREEPEAQGKLHGGFQGEGLLRTAAANGKGEGGADLAELDLTGLPFLSHEGPTASDGQIRDDLPALKHTRSSAFGNQTFNCRRKTHRASLPF